MWFQLLKISVFEQPITLFNSEKIRDLRLLKEVNANKKQWIVQENQKKTGTFLRESYIYETKDTAGIRSG